MCLSGFVTCCRLIFRNKMNFLKEVCRVAVSFLAGTFSRAMCGIGRRMACGYRMIGGLCHQVGGNPGMADFSEENDDEKPGSQSNSSIVGGDIRDGNGFGRGVLARCNEEAWS
jgi:hypothetical protein